MHVVYKHQLHPPKHNGDIAAHLVEQCGLRLLLLAELTGLVALVGAALVDGATQLCYLLLQFLDLGAVAGQLRHSLQTIIKTGWGYEDTARSVWSPEENPHDFFLNTKV